MTRRTCSVAAAWQEDAPLEARGERERVGIGDRTSVLFEAGASSAEAAGRAARPPRSLYHAREDTAKNARKIRERRQQAAA